MQNPDKLRVAYIAAGAAGMICGSCLRDNALVTALQKLGCDAVLIPTYTPLRLDEEDVSLNQVFFGGINVFLQQKSALFRRLPRSLDRALDHPALLKKVAAGSIPTEARLLGDLALSMLRGSDGYQAKEVERLVDFLEEVIQPHMVNLTNMLIAGKTVVVVGYGWVGRGVAMRLRGMGARVIVVETAASLNQQKQSGFHRGLEALYDGNWVMSMEEAAAMGDIFITATGNKHVISKHHFKRMKENVILANAGHFNNEIDVDSLQAMSKESKEIMPNLVRYRLKNGKGILLLSEGRLVNLARPSGHGHPIEIMDGSFAVQALCVEYLAKSSDSLKPEVYDVPSDLDEEVARLALAAQGIALQKPTPQQIEYVSAWEEGT